MSNTQPINKRKTEYTEKLSVDLSKHISTNPVGHIEIDLSLGMTSPFPSLSHASKSLCIPIVDPETVLDLVSEALPHLEKKEQHENSNIIFEQQALLIIEVTMFAVLKCLSSLLQQYFPRSEDYEEAFKKALDKIKPIIDSLVFDQDILLQTQITSATKDEFDKIISQLGLEEE